MGIKELINSKNFKEYLHDCGEMEEGERYKHDMCFATLTLKIEDEDVERFPELKDYVGFIVQHHGTTSYSNGWDSYEDVHMYKVTSVESQMESDFWELMEHLNSAENDMAEDFAKKYMKSVLDWEEIH